MSLEEGVCFWSKLYETQKKKGEVEDYMIEQGCYLCSGSPNYCDSYSPFKENYQSFIELI